MFNNIHDRLYILCRIRNLSVKSIAIDFHVHPSTVSDWINCEGTPKYERLVAIADKYNCSLDWLTGRAPLEAIDFKERTCKNDRL